MQQRVETDEIETIMSDIETAAKIHTLTNQSFLVEEGELQSRNQGKALKGFLDRVLKRDQVVAELQRYAGASGQIFICSHSWEHHVITDLDSNGNWITSKFYRFLVLTGDGFRIADSKESPANHTDSAGLETMPNDASVIRFWSRVNGLHRRAIAQSGTDALVVHQYLRRHCAVLAGEQK